MNWRSGLRGDYRSWVVDVKLMIDCRSAASESDLAGATFDVECTDSRIGILRFAVDLLNPVFASRSYSPSNNEPARLGLVRMVGAGGLSIVAVAKSEPMVWPASEILLWGSLTLDLNPSRIDQRACQVQRAYRLDIQLRFQLELDRLITAGRGVSRRFGARG